MSDEIIKVPDIGSGEAEVIEICIKPGDTVSAEDSLIVLESDKATMEVPAPRDGVVTEVLLNIGDNVAEGAPMVKMAAAGDKPAAAPQAEAAVQPAAPAPAAEAAPAGGTHIESVRVPDIGAENVPVIEVCVKVGDTVALEDSLIVLESDKATMEVPSPVEGVVKAIHVKEGDALNQGDLVIDVEANGGGAVAVAEVPAPVSAPAAVTAAAPAPQAGSRIEKVMVPDIGAENVPVIEVCVSVGDQIEEEASLIVLESDKATMEVPSPFTGVVKAITVKEGDTLSQGDLILDIEVSGGAVAPVVSQPAPAAAAPVPAPQKAEVPSRAPSAPPPRAEANPVELERVNRKYHAGPAVRKLAREFGVDLADVSGTGPRRRILKEDVQKYVKTRLNEKPKAAQGVSSGLGIPAMPEIDFSKWGEVEKVALNRLRKVAAQNFQRSWLNVPHVTQFDECDITELEVFRKAQKALAEARGTKLTPLPFILKAVAYVLKELPQFCTSLSPDGETLIYKKYINIGVAVDTPDGLLVPVIKNVDQKSLWELSAECIELAGKARDKKLKPDEMQGGCFTISSLGSIGGTAFTPIVNAPEVAILGLSKASMKPVWNGKDFDPKLMLPLSLSYDHRAINGADAARFTTMLGELLTDIRKLLL
ncbi:dihydrolipoyllysine-residue acetyltransferase [Endozoicomonas elysicola]|uniref:Acetyltransferase component of pyruvate dehydrogenase complex n=1 Tax=Endozoicomonas elysicola TaxID=305900 RepID=A0A081K6Z0_9GAMM|nr:dihydrolipoyllysine-residue acetyltransferase [Endozoicomonas elysicola]KEI69916.1 dihydrolipoamide acetyltransferase [Endozoicomonas elysicola]